MATMSEFVELQAENERLLHSFKNFHRLLCERFGYVHDDIDWQRDQVSLIEHIARASSEPVDAQELWLAARGLLAYGHCDPSEEDSEPYIAAWNRLDAALKTTRPAPPPLPVPMGGQHFVQHNPAPNAAAPTAPSGQFGFTTVGAAQPPSANVAPYLTALVRYIDDWYGVAMKYGVPAKDAACQAKHAHDAVLGIRKLLGIEGEYSSVTKASEV